MNLGTWISKKVIKTGLFVSNWKVLPKQMRWTLLGMYDQDDESVYMEAAARSDKVKPRPFFAKANMDIKREMAEKRKKQRGKKKEKLDWFSMGADR